MEYSVMQFEVDLDMLVVQARLNEVGADGWEHYDTVPCKTDDGTDVLMYFFKRSKDV